MNLLYEQYLLDYENCFIIALLTCIHLIHDCYSDVSDSASQPNTVEMFSAPTITEDSKSYTTFERKSIEDFDEYRPYNVSPFPVSVNLSETF